MSLKFKGVTLVEITIVAGILVILTSIVIIVIKPQEFKAKARDTKRVQDITKLYEAFLEYKLKYGVYPGVVNHLYKSNVGFSSNLTDAKNGWIDSDLSEFLQIQNIDPVNSGNLLFQYINNGPDFEINSILEIKKETMQKDKGNNLDIFEIGTDLEILN